ncbi:hypothetical protein E4U21_004608 [Claviceps maximensis]|nr:hypothetical protein E4U21_004608 [Claviceps maximensis]
MCAKTIAQPTTTVVHTFALASGCFLSGAMFCISAIMIPTLLDTNTESRSLVAHWARLYHYGSMMMPSMSAAIGVVYGYAATQYKERHRKQRMRCIAAGALTMGIAPFTFWAMAATNNALFAIKDSASDVAASADVNVMARDLVMRWAFLHSIRSFLPLAGVMVAFWGISETQQSGVS